MTKGEISLKNFESGLACSQAVSLAFKEEIGIPEDILTNMSLGFGGGFGGANMQQLMRQAQKMQEDMKRSREEIDNTEYTSSVGGGMVEVTLYGNRTVKSVRIKPEVVDPDDVEMLEDLVASALGDALNKIAEDEKTKLPNLGM